MIKKWVVFSLSESISGIGNDGVHYDDNSFTIDRVYDGIFDTENEADKYITDTLTDYASRKIKNARFVSMKIWFLAGDKIFDIK